MLDDLRNSSSFNDEEEPQQPLEGQTEQSPYQRPVRRRKKQQKFMGMTAQQRFVVAVFLLMMVCVMGFGFLLVMGNIYLPF